MADNPSEEGLWFAGAFTREMLMAHKPRISLDPEKVILLTAVLGLLEKIAEIVIKAVSYVCCNPKFQLQVYPARKAGFCTLWGRTADWN